MQSSTSADQPHRYSADRPLEELKDDRLDRKGFVERLAADIASWHGAESLVISLNGAWGSGKTTLKNFLRGELRARSNPLIVEFNPWQWSGQDRVFDAFFSAMRAQFQKTDSDRETEKLAKRWESFARWTKFGATISTKVEQAVTPLLGTSVIGALLAGSSPRPEVRYLGVVLAVIGVALSVFFSVAPEIAAALVEYVRGKLGSGKKELAELREEITAQLKALKEDDRPVLVIVDDIDRLTQDEIRLVFQLVKANADFPNVVYLLLFQKDIVVSALSKVIADRGEDYLKKIVQVEFDVPQAPRRKMLHIFEDDLQRIFDRAKPKMYWDKDRIQGLFQEHLWPYFRTLRDVKRFLGTFDYYFSGHVNGGVLEVNPIDLLTVEILRNFDHDAFVAVRDSLGFASRDDFAAALMGDGERKKQVDAVFKSLTHRTNLSPRESERLGVVLRSLFPDSEDRTKHEHDLRICHPKHFDKYFEHAVDESATSAASVEAILTMTSDRKAFSGRLRDVVKSGAVTDVLEKLGVYFEKIPTEAAPSFVTALFDVGEEFPPESPGFLNEDPILKASRLIYFLLKRIPEEEKRAQILRESLTATTGIVLPVATLAFIEPAKGDRREEVILGEAHLKKLHPLAVAKIQAMASDGTIWKSRLFPRLVNNWRRWAGPDVVSAWLETELVAPARRLEFIGRYVGEATSGSEVVSYSLPARFLEEMIGLEETAKAIASVSTDNVREQVARELLDEALQLKQKGQPYGTMEVDADRRIRRIRRG